MRREQESMRQRDTSIPMLEEETLSEDAPAISREAEQALRQAQQESELSRHEEALAHHIAQEVHHAEQQKEFEDELSSLDRTIQDANEFLVSPPRPFSSSSTVLASPTPTVLASPPHSLPPVKTPASHIPIPKAMSPQPQRPVGVSTPVVPVSSRTRSRTTPASASAVPTLPPIEKPEPKSKVTKRTKGSTQVSTAKASGFGRRRIPTNEYQLAENRLSDLIQQKKALSIAQMRQVEAFNNQIEAQENISKQNALTQLQYDRFLKDYQKSLEDFRRE